MITDAFRTRPDPFPRVKLQDHHVIATSQAVASPACSRIFVDDPFRYSAQDNKPHLVVLVGGPGDDDLEFVNTGLNSDGQLRSGVGQALLVGGGGNNTLVAGSWEYGYLAIGDPTQVISPNTSAAHYRGADQVLLNDLHLADLHPQNLDFTNFVVRPILASIASQSPDAYASPGGSYDVRGNPIAGVDGFHWQSTDFYGNRIDHVTQSWPPPPPPKPGFNTLVGAERGDAVLVGGPLGDDVIVGGGNTRVYAGASFYPTLGVAQYVHGRASSVHVDAEDGTKHNVSILSTAPDSTLEL